MFVNFMFSHRMMFFEKNILIIIRLEGARIMNTSQLFKKILLGAVAVLFSASVWAHGGAKGTDTDQCKFELEPDHWIHYTAYQPNAFPAEEFCADIPRDKEALILVFDYQDQKYKDDTVEFEVTKEPEGTRVFFLQGAKHKKGTVELKLPNGVPEPGKYLIHITLVPDQGERKDVHMAFKAGGGPSASNSTKFIYLLLGFAALYVLYLYNATFKGIVDGIIGKAKA
ncbi:hypothetical protein MGMO_138c00160 [Methyloglobulus morosus KoM1]|uniref:Uncharacterized protein n=2 Tax=Methyloglobulus TaxID=1410680 RepID=V5BXB5_9GAMM|nr:hypothetical protein MGMO_138c00160 [Methyloglobulus morosus KoM1]